MIPDRIFLCGYTGTNTLEVGRILAERFGRPLFDTDQILEAGARMTVADVRRTEGESGLRQRERRALVAVATGPPGIISTSPDIFVDRGNRRTIMQSGISVYIDAPLEDCLKGALSRGLLRPEDPANERFTTNYDLRRPEYEKADVIVDAMGRDAESVADDIIQRLEDRVWTEKFA